MTVKVAGGNTVAAPGDYWYPRDEFVQLQLSGGSIPGEEIERVTFDEALKTLTVKLKDQGDVPYDHGYRPDGVASGTSVGRYGIRRRAR